MAGGRFKSLVSSVAMRRIIQAVTIWTVLFGISDVSIASPIVFRFASDGGTAGNQWIVADGEITAATPDEFATFLKAKDVKIGARYEVYLNSP